MSDEHTADAALVKLELLLAEADLAEAIRKAEEARNANGQDPQ